VWQWDHRWEHYRDNNPGAVLYAYRAPIRFELSGLPEFRAAPYSPVDILFRPLLVPLYATRFAVFDWFAYNAAR